MSVLNTHLSTRTYLVGERITLADISVACTLLHLYSKVMDPAYRKPYSHVNRWFLTVVNQPQFKAVNGEPKLCDKPAEVDPKKFQQQQQQSGIDLKYYFNDDLIITNLSCKLLLIIMWKITNLIILHLKLKLVKRRRVSTPHLNNNLYTWMLLTKHFIFILSHLIFNNFK